ncbi:MAG: anti-sigma factor [Rhodobacteraceae bacterium PARR1]|nr:MAG: anti-sigma factor [Rhodobacteraceae bacterium PARR1]
MEVRLVLTRLRRASVLRGLSPESAESCELVLAEAMNNIVEHAYGGGDGSLRLTLLRGRHHVICRLLDRGRPLPGLTLPPGRLPPQDDSPAEGGYGWFLIHSLSQRLHYRRADGMNRLFIVVTANSRAA